MFLGELLHQSGLNYVQEMDEKIHQHYYIIVRIQGNKMYKNMPILPTSKYILFLINDFSFHIPIFPDLTQVIPKISPLTPTVKHFKLPLFHRGTPMVHHIARQLLLKLHAA